MLNSASTNHDFFGSGQLAFLRRVTQDERFRAELQVDPQAMLAEYGLHVDPEHLPSTVTLPRQEAFVDFLDELSQDSEDNVNPRQIVWAGLFGD